MCKKNGVSVDHLLLHCEVATRLWHYVFTLFGIEWVMPRSFLDFLAYWNRVGGRDISKVIWKMVTSCVTWCIWQERNAQTFEDKEFGGWDEEEYDIYATLLGVGPPLY